MKVASSNEIGFSDDDISIIFSNLRNDKYLASQLNEIFGQNVNLVTDRQQTGKKLVIIFLYLSRVLRNDEYLFHIRLFFTLILFSWP